MAPCRPGAAMATGRQGVAFLPEYALLVGSGPFWSRAEDDIAAARRRLFVQALTFEGDRAGLAVAAALHASGAADRRVLVDDFTRAVVNDHFVVSPHYLASAAFRAEIRATRAMFRGLQHQGVAVRATNPIRGSPIRYGLRNHKKLILADDVAYIGGINFSDHNFAWHDLMLRIEGAGPADFLAGDFEATWDGRGTFAKAEYGDLRLYALDGGTNAAGLADLMAAIDGAAQSIEIVTPYLSFPFTDRLAAAARRGVAVDLFTPWANNKPMVRDYQLAVAARSGFRVVLMDEMSHLKAMLIDGHLLVLGSINFDFPSYFSLEEYVALIDNPVLVADFRARVLDPIRRSALSRVDWRPSPWRALRSHMLLHFAGAAMARTGRIRRDAVDWRA